MRQRRQKSPLGDGGRGGCYRQLLDPAGSWSRTMIHWLSDVLVSGINQTGGELAPSLALDWKQQ